MKRYNNSNRNDTFPQTAVLVDVPVSVTTPAYCKFPSKVDKTFFRPGVSELAQIASVGRIPQYDTVNGVMPDYGINIAWLRSPARDRVDIDNAKNMVEQIIESEKKEDIEVIKGKAHIKDVAKAIGEAVKTSDSSEDSAKQE